MAFGDVVELEKTPLSRKDQAPHTKRSEGKQTDDRREALTECV